MTEVDEEGFPVVPGAEGMDGLPEWVRQIWSGQFRFIEESVETLRSGIQWTQQWWSEHSKFANDSVQAIYASLQALKFDLSLMTFAYDLVKFDEGGLTVAGAQVWRPGYIQKLEEKINQRWSRFGNEPSITRTEMEERVATVRQTANSARDEARQAASDLRNMRQRVSGARAPRQEPSRGFMGLGRTRVDVARLRTEVELLRAALG